MLRVAGNSDCEGAQNTQAKSGSEEQGRHFVTPVSPAHPGHQGEAVRRPLKTPGKEISAGVIPFPGRPSHEDSVNPEDLVE